jgi:hypothetical protein
MITWRAKSRYHGFIAPPKEPKPIKEHFCMLPAMWYRCLGTLWRCKCGAVYRLKYYGEYGGGWSKTTIEDWTNAGGKE